MKNNEQASIPSTTSRKNPKNVIRGAINRAQGLEFENQINEACEFYRSGKHAVITKTPEPMKILKSLGEGRFVACFAKKAEPDYKGTLKGGKTVVFEAKYTMTEQMNARAVDNDQWKILEDYYAIGAICFVVAGFSTGNCYRVPWRIWRDMKAHFGHKYFTEQEADYYKLPRINGTIMFLGDVKGSVDAGKAKH